jgi:hypothetical protein
MPAEHHYARAKVPHVVLFRGFIYDMLWIEAELVATKMGALVCCIVTIESKKNSCDGAA